LFDGSLGPSLHSSTFVQVWPLPLVPALHVQIASPEADEGSLQVA
jgi:hypothetical protein